MAVEQSNGAAPVGDPVAPSDRAALALATAAQALLAAIECLRGGTPPGLLTVPGLSPSAGQSLSVVEVVNEFMVAKARAGRSDRYLRQLRVSLSSFSRGRSHVPLTAVTVSDVEQWLFNRGWSPRTMRGYLADVRTLFNFAIRRGYQMRSPASAVELPCDASMHEPPAIHTPRQLAQLLTTARTADLDVCRHLAIRYFTGVRSAEAHRLREENILADYVEVPAVKAKTRRRRLIKIQPVLRAWLTLGGTLRAMHPSTVRRVVKASGVTFPRNVTRHSFCSYHLAMWENAGKTALEAGHSEQMLFNHYRELVTRDAAREFWGLTPERARSVSESS